MNRTLKGVLLAGLLSGCIAMINWVFGWPVMHKGLSSFMMAFCIVSVMAAAAGDAFSTSEYRHKQQGKR
jgi:hypothetical protein